MQVKPVTGLPRFDRFSRAPFPEPLCSGRQASRSVQRRGKDIHTLFDVMTATVLETIAVQHNVRRHRPPTRH
jgi:hypothetical protein